MSEPQTNIPVEDVLTSIRRLVSQGARRSADEAVGALVLTPSLRVVPPPGGTDDAQAEVEAEPDETWDDAEIEALVRLDGPGSEPEDDDHGAEAEEDAPAPRGAEFGTDEAEELDGLPDRAKLAATIAELEDAVARQVEDWEPEGSESAEDVDWSVADTGAAAFFSSRLAQREGGAAPLTLVNPEHVPDRPRGAAVDEDTLRRVVAEVLREELAGELGQRITRNVRRLVRREIGQALSLRELS